MRQLGQVSTAQGGELTQKQEGGEEDLQRKGTPNAESDRIKRAPAEKRAPPASKKRHCAQVLGEVSRHREAGEGEPSNKHKELKGQVKSKRQAEQLKGPGEVGKSLKT